MFSWEYHEIFKNTYFEERLQTGADEGFNLTCPTFRVMSPNILGNVLKHSEECPKHSGECPKHSGECPQTFQEMLQNIPGNALKHSLLFTNDAVKR